MVQDTCGGEEGRAVADGEDGMETGCVARFDEFYHFLECFGVGIFVVVVVVVIEKSHSSRYDQHVCSGCGAKGMCWHDFHFESG